MDRLLAELIDPQLSAKIEIFVGCFAYFIPQRILDSQMASLKALHCEIYSASQEDRSKLPCFLERYERGRPKIMKTKLLVDLRFERQLAQSESLRSITLAAEEVP